MSEQSQTSASQQEKQNKPKNRLDAAEQIQDQATASELTKGTAEATGNRSMQGQAAHLSDARSSAAQRRAMAVQIGRVAGNQRLLRIMSQANVGEHAPPRVASQEEGPLHGTVSADSSQSGVVRRHDLPSGQPHVTLEPFGDLTTYAQLAAVARFGIGQVQADLRDAHAGHPVHARAAQWIAGLRGWLPYLQRQGSAQLTAGAAAQAGLHLEEGVAIRAAIADAQRAIVRREMNRVAARARAAARQAERLRPHLNDCLRAAFRSGDSSAIASVTGTIGSVVDIGLGFQTLARQSAEAAASLRRVDIPAVGRYVTALNSLNSGLAAFNLAFSLTQTQATTQLEEGMRQVTVAAGAFSSLATLAGLPAHMGLYANLYLVPLTNAIMAGLSRLTVHLQRENDIWAAVFGAPGRFGVEPGGRPMWRFMVAVMRAGGAAGVPQISAEVAAYLVAHRAALEAGSGEAVPTSGWWFWRSLSTARARRWVFNNRDRVWAMFYGSRAVPN